MKHIQFLAGVGLALTLTMTGTAAMAQDAPGTCYIQLRKLMAEPPEGVGDLGAAIRQLEIALRPQVDEIKQLKADLDSVQQRQRDAVQDDSGRHDLVALHDEADKLTADLAAKQDQLKLDYAAQQRVLLMPVQTRVAERAQAFGSTRGCGEIKMARTPDLAALEAAAARDVTGEFVAWYVQNPG